MRAASRPSGRWASGLYPYLVGLLTPLVIEPAIGARYLTIANWLREFYGLPRGERERWRQERLREILAYASREVPFYRALAREGARELRLEELPIVGKGLIREDMERFAPANWMQIPHVNKKSGGSTAEPWQYPLDKRAWAHFYGACLHQWETLGYRYGERIVLLGTPPALHPAELTWKTRLRFALERRVVSTTGTDIGPEASLERAIAASQAGGSLWYGYPSIAAAMADAVLERGRRLPGPKAIVTTSEMLQPQWRSRIEQAFGAPVHDEYGCNDGGVLAQSCPRGRLHLAENVSIVEIMDGDSPAEPGTEGDVVATNLHARTLPFLRYRTGDRAVLRGEPCPCGHDGATLERLAGRKSDVVKLDGRQVPIRAIGATFRAAPSVRRWQLVQPRRGALRMRLDAGPGFDGEQREQLLGALHRACGSSVGIELTTSEPIERTAGGKVKLVVREVE